MRAPSSQNKFERSRIEVELPGRIPHLILGPIKDSDLGSSDGTESILKEQSFINKSLSVYSSE